MYKYTYTHINKLLSALRSWDYPKYLKYVTHTEWPSLPRYNTKKISLIDLKMEDVFSFQTQKH
jgi:hypothetical protein